jgi:hypothetical protein
MSGHYTRGFRALGMRARIGIAAAVLAGGSAAGVIAAAAGHDGAATAQAAAYGTGYRHTTSAQSALTMAATGWPKSPAMTGKTFATLARMVPMRNFAQVKHQRTTLAAQRGVVEFASKKILVVISANKAERVWLVSHGTKLFNVAASSMGMAAMSGGTMDAPRRMAMKVNGIAAGDLVFVAGIKEHRSLVAKLVLFVAPAQVMPTGTASPTATATAPATVRPTVTAPATVMPTAPAPAASGPVTLAPTHE